MKTIGRDILFGGKGAATFIAAIDSTDIVSLLQDGDIEITIADDIVTIVRLSDGAVLEIPLSQLTEQQVFKLRASFAQIVPSAGEAETPEAADKTRKIPGHADMTGIQGEQPPADNAHGQSGQDAANGGRQQSAQQPAGTEGNLEQALEVILSDDASLELQGLQAGHNLHLNESNVVNTIGMIAGNIGNGGSTQMGLDGGGGGTALARMIGSSIQPAGGGSSLGGGFSSGGASIASGGGGGGGGSGGSETGSGTITAPPAAQPVISSVVSIANPSTSVTEGTDTHVSFTVSLSEVASHDLIVSYRTVNGTAGANDFNAATSTLLIPAGSSSGVISIALTDDNRYEVTETFKVELVSAQTVTGSPANINPAAGSATATILDNDTPPTVSISPVTVTEGQDAVFTITLDRLSDVPVTGNWSVLAGTAGAADLGGTLPSGTFTIPAGSLTATITISTSDDGFTELSENFTLNLSGIAGAQNTSIGAIGTIEDNEVGVTFSTVMQSVNEGDGTATVQFVLGQPYAHDVAVTYRTVTGSAGAGDFTSVSMATVTIPAGLTTASVSIAITDDTVFEGGNGTFENFTVEIVSAQDSNGDPVNHANTPHTIQIIDNDSLPTLTLTPVQAGEGDNFTFIVTASHPSVNAITGSWSLLAGTADAADFGGTFPSGIFTIPAGSTTATITFASLEDVNVEANETFTLVLDNILNAQGGPVSTIGTILNDDYAVSLDTSAVTVNEGAGTAQVSVSLSSVHTQDVIITYRTLTGTAGIGDFTGTVSSTVTIPAGSTTAVITIPITDDTIYDGGNESFQVQLVGAVDAGGHAVGVGNSLQTVTIIDNDIAPTLTMTPVSQAEGGMFTFTVTASHASGLPVTGNWSLLAGSANAADFGGTFPSGTFTIPAGSTTATITFSSVDDSVVEPHETFTLVLDSLTNAQAGPVSTTGTILNNDFAVSLDAGTITVGEGDGTATATVTLTSAYAHDITVTYRTVTGTAGASDFTGTASSTVTIPAGSTTATISIPITDDVLYDGGNENFQIEIIGAVDSNSTSIPVGQATQTVTIVDNEAAPVLTMTPISQTEGGAFVFTVTASRAADAPITGNWSVLAGTANAADFGGTLPTGIFTIPAGSTTTTITFSSIDDVAIEGNETFTLVLDSINNAQAGPVSTTGTIVNNDFAVSIAATPVTVNEGDGNAQVTVSINGPHTEDIVITYRTVSGTAGNGDFTGTSLSTITIPAGSTSATILVPITNDTVYESANESFQVEIISAADTNGQNITVASSTQTVTIVDNEAAPTLTMGNVSQTEGGLFTFTVTASHTSNAPITGTWTAQAGTANAADFGGTLPSGTFTIAPGSTTAVISFTSSQDTQIEGNETFGVLLDSISGAQTTPILATGTILNDDFGVNIDTATATVGEADGTHAVVFTISAAYAQDVTITYRTVSQTAGASDYTAVATATVVIPAGQTSVTANIAITNDALYDQGDETFLVEIISARDTSLNNIPVGQATQTVTIVDDESAPSLSIAPVTATEGSVMTFTITASHAADGPITGNWNVLAGTADAADFGGSLPTGMFTIPAGQTSVTISIPTSQDSTAEANETFTLQLSSVNGAQTGSVSAIGTITNDDYEVRFSQAADSVNESAGTHTARVDLSMAYPHDITITYRTVAITANGTDYTAVATGTVTIPANSYYADISIPITNDTLYEGNETFRIELLSAVDSNSNPVPLGTATQTVTIIDNETIPVLSVADQTVMEGGTFTYTLTLSNASAQDVTGSWQVLAGTANAADFGGTLPTGTFIIPAGSTTATITISTANDTIAEQLYETFSLRLYDITHTSQNTVVANGTIEDNDVQVYVSSTGQTVSEGAGAASVTFQLNRSYAQDITVNYRTVNGTANGLDFTAVAGASIVIPAGQTSVTINIPITDDNLYEAGAENFAVEIVSAQDSFANPITVGTNNSHTVNITDNDTPPALTINSASAVEGGNIVFTVTANRISSEPITGTWSVSAGTATASDFGGTLPTGTFTIPAGSLTATITVPTTDDVAQEGTENFTLTIDNISGAQAGPVSGTGTILDNEMAVSMSLTASSVSEGVGNATITVSLSQVHTHDVIIGYRTVAGTADGSDFVAVPTGTITIPAGSLSANITIAINDDTMYDGGNETFQVQLLSAEDTNNQPISVGSANHTVTITDNETAPVLTMGDIVRTEGGTFTFTITASGTSDSPITGDWNVFAGTATAADFAGGVLPAGTFTIPVGMTSTTITFGTYDDTLQEGSETFTVGLGNITGADPTPVTANGIIQDNELSVAFALGSSAVNESSGVAPITITLSQAMTKDVTVYYRTVTGTAGPADFTQVTNSAVIIPAGQTSATINIGINDDIIYDGAPETFQVQLLSAQDSDGTSIPVSIVNHQVLINDNDPAPTVTLSDMTINEGGTATFTITRHGLTDEPITGNWQIQAGTANAADFGGTLPSGIFTLPAGQNSITVTVSTFDDLLSEGTETFTIVIDNMTNTSTTSATSNGAIIDNELSVSFSATTGAVAENGIGYNATIQINHPHTHDITVTYSTVVGTAGSSDFTEVTGQTVVILAGQTSVQVPITIKDDFIIEGNETFQIKIDSAVDGNSVAVPVSTGTQTVTITDDDVDLQISFANPNTSVLENAGSATIRINLNQTHNEDVIITYNTSNGTATAGSDYTGTGGNVTITIPAGQSYVNIPVTILDDNIYENAPSENFNINIVSAQDQSGRPVGIDGASIHQVTIIENDAVLFVQFEQASSTVAEEAGSVSTRVLLNRAHTSDITITYRTVNGTATHGSDYTGTGSGTATVTIPAGQTSVLLPYAIIDDNTHEYAASENFTIELVSAVDAASQPVSLNGTVNHTVTITDSDPLPTITVNAPPSPENTDYVFTINLSGKAAHDVTGTWTFLPGTATAADFDNGAAMPSGTFTILAGTTVAIITVPTIDDDISEGYEDFTIRIDNITGADSTAILETGQLVDDELNIGFDTTSAMVTEGASHTATIEMSFATLEDVVVTYEIVGIDATAGVDFIAGTGSVTIAAGQTTASILVQTLQDTLNEANEQFKIRLTGVSTTGPVTPQIAPTQQEQIITIDDDELDPTITMTVPGFVNENGGAQIVSVERSTNSGVTNSVNVRFDGAGFTVTYAGTTYNAGQVFTVTFAGFLNSQNITFTPINNGTFNGDSTVTVTLSDPVNARLPTTSYSFSLLDDEASTTEEYGYGYPGPIIDGKVHGPLVGDDGRNVLSIGETVIASIIRNVTVDPKSGIDQVRMQTQTGVHHILDNEVLAGANGRAIIELTTGAAGDSIVSGNIIRASAQGDDIVALRTLGGKVGAVSGNKIYLAEGTFAGADGTNDLTLSTLNANAGSVLTQNSAGIIGNNIVTGGDGDDIVTVRTAGNNAGTWSGNVANLSGAAAASVSAVLLKDGGYVVAYQAGANATYMIMNMDGTTRVAATVLNSSGYYPEIAVLDNGNIVFVYQFNTSAQDIRMQIVAPDGTSVLAATTVMAAGTTVYPQITKMADGGFAIVWHDTAASTVTIARFNASGTQTFTETISQTGNEYTPAIAALQNGGYVVTWYNNSSGNQDIYFQRYNADNSKAGSIVAVSNGPSSDNNPQITTLKDGGFAIAWRNVNTQENNYAITASIYNADGTLRAGNVLVSRTQGIHEILSEITSLSDGGFVVTYYRAAIYFGGVYSGTDAYMVRFDKNGMMVGDEVRIGTNGGDATERYANIVEMRDGNLMAVYYEDSRGVVSQTITPPGASVIQGNDFALGDGANRLIVDAQSGTGRAALNDAYDQNSGGSGSVISGNRVLTGNGVDEVLLTASSGIGGNAVSNSSGGSYSKQWAIDSTSPSGNTDYGITAAGLADGRFAIVWAEVVGTGNDVFIQLYDRNGSAIGNQAVVADIGTDSLRYPSVTGLADGGYVVSWQNPTVTGGAIQYVVYNADGSTRVAMQTLDSGSNQDYHQDVTALADGGFVVVWSEINTTGGSYYRIRVARFDEDGNAVGDQLVLAPSSSTQNAQGPDVVATADGGYIVSWYNAATLEWQRFDAAGKAVTGVIATPGAYSGYHSQVTVLANGNILVTQNGTPSTTTGRMVIYNQSGLALQILSSPSSVMYRAQAMPLADGGFIVAYKTSSADLYLARYTADGLLLGTVVVVTTTEGATNAEKALSIAPVGEDSFVVTWTTGTVPYAAMYKFSDTFNVGGDASVIENNNVATHGNDDVITLSTSGGTGGSAAESGGGSNGSQLLTQAGDASVIQNNVIDAGDGNDIVNLSATGGNSDYTKIDGKTAQVLDNKITTGAGNDQVNITASGGNGNALSNRVANNVIDMGGGNDSLTSYSTHFLRNSVALGTGDNSATITAEFFNDNIFTSGNGGDSIIVSGVRTAHNNNISLGAGNDSFTLNSSAPALTAGRGQTIDNLSSTAALAVPQTAVLSNGNYVTTWYESVGGNNNVYAQVFDKYGQAVGARISVAATAAAEIYPSVTGIAGGGFVVSYTDSTNNNFYMAKYNASGVQQGSTAQIPDNGSQSAYTTQLATLTNGQIVVIRMENTSGYFHTYRTVYNQDMTVAQSSYDITTNTLGSTASTYYPSVIATSDGGYIVAYYYSGSANTYISKYSSSHVNSWNYSQSTGATSGSGSNPSAKLLELSNGNILMYWSNGTTFYRSLYNSAGSAIAASSAPLAGTGAYSDALAMPGGEFIVFSTNASTGLYATTFDASGNLKVSAPLLTAALAITQVEVEKIGDSILLQYAAGDKIYQQIMTNDASASVSGLELDLGDGTNNASVTTNYIVSADITSGSGDDTITLVANTRAIQNEINMGNGTNILNVTGGEFDIWSVTGGINKDTVTFSSTANADRLTINLYAGANELTISAASTINNLTYTGGIDGDKLTLTGGSTMNNTLLTLGGGFNDVDIVLTGANASIQTFNLSGGDETDTVDITTQRSISAATLSLGAGANTVNMTTQDSGQSITSLSITGTSGTDNYTITSAGALLSSTFTMGAGNNSADLKANNGAMNDLGITSLGGNDTIKARSSGTMNTATINAGDGTNNIDLQSTGSNMNGLNLTTGAGADTVLLRAAGQMSGTVIALGAGTNDLDIILTGGSGLINTFDLTTGDDNDTVDITTSQGINAATIGLGAGANTVNITMQSAAQTITSLSITGTTGVDNYTVTSAGALNTSTFTLGAGNNIIDLKANGGTMATLGITALGGDDTVTTRSTGHMDNATVNLGDGTNIINMRSTGGTMNVAQVTTGIGDDTVTLQSSGNMNNATILTSSGNDTLSMTAGGTITDAVINLGIGDNSATFSGTINNMQFTAGSNNDILNFVGGRMNSGTFNLGIGDSTMTVTSGVAAFNGVSYTTGSGRDVVTINTAASGNSFSLGSGEDMLILQSIGNNTISLGIQTNVLDTLKLTASGAHNMASLGGQVTGVEIVSIANSQVNTLTVDRGTVLQADNYGGQKILFIKGDASDTVNIIKGPGTVTNTGATQDFDGVTYRVIEHNEGTPVYFFVQQGVTVMVDGGPLTFDNPIAADLTALEIDTSPVTIARTAEGQTAPQAAVQEGAKVITYALYGGSGDDRMGGPIAQAAASVFAFYQAELAARGVHVVFVEAKDDGTSMFAGHADISIGLGNGILGHMLDNPNSVLGISAGQEGEAYSMIMNAPDAPAGLDAGVLAGDIFLSDAYLKLASMDTAHGGGVQEGSLAYYVLMQEIGHSLGLEEKTDEELAQDGYDASVAHQSTTTDETVEGLDSLDDLTGMHFASTPGEAALDQLAHIMQEDFNAATHTSADWIQPDYASVADLIAQFSHDPDSVALADQFQSQQSYQEFLAEFMQTHLPDAAPITGGGMVDTALAWAQELSAALPPLPAAETSAAPAADTPAAPPLEQLAADVASVPMPDDRETAHA